APHGARRALAVFSHASLYKQMGRIVRPRPVAMLELTFLAVVGSHERPAGTSQATSLLASALSRVCTGLPAPPARRGRGRRQKRKASRWASRDRRVFAGTGPKARTSRKTA